MSNYIDKLKRAELIINDHNKYLTAQLSWDTIKAKIIEFGGTTEETLREMTWEDLQDCGIPRVLARRIANQVFRQTSYKLEDLESMSLSELFRLYDPSGETNPSVTERLSKESNGNKCVIFVDGKVDANASAALLRELKQGLPERDYIGINEVFRIGENPNQFVDENFLFPGNPLRNGFCHVTNRDMTKIPLEIRQIIYLAICGNELRCENVHDAHEILDMLVLEDALDKVQARYTNAVIKLNNMKQLNQAPALKLQKKPSNKPNDPFYKHRQY